MKKIFRTIKLVTLAAAMGLGFSSCDNEDYLVITAVEPSDALVFTNNLENEYLISSQTASNVAERFVWSTPDFGAPTPVEYALEGSVNADFSTTDYNSGAISENNQAVKVKDLMEMAEALGLDADPSTTDENGAPNNTGEVYFRVKAFVGDQSAANGVNTVSEVASMTITLIEATGNDFVCELDQYWLVGAGVPDAGWGWGTPVALPCAGDGVYAGNVNLNNNGGADNNFRFFTVEGDWGSGQNFPYFEGEGYTIDSNFVNAGDGDSNFGFVGVTGEYYLTVDTVNKTITLETAKYDTCELEQLWLVGAGITDAGWGWDTPVALFCAGNGVYSGFVNLQNNDGSDNNFRIFTANGDWGSGLNFPYYEGEGYTIDSNFENAGDGDSNFAFTGTSGRYILTVDTVNKTITLQ